MSKMEDSVHAILQNYSDLVLEFEIQTIPLGRQCRLPGATAGRGEGSVGGSASGLEGIGECGGFRGRETSRGSAARAKRIRAAGGGSVRRTPMGIAEDMDRSDPPWATLRSQFDLAQEPEDGTRSKHWKDRAGSRRQLFWCLMVRRDFQ